MCISKNILSALAYFDLFDYPLTRREIFLFLPHDEELHQFDRALNALIKSTSVFHIGEFYSLQNNDALAERRRQGNERAAKMLKKARKIARLISAFPFVTGVAVSGSLSKRFADASADIDFFIITAANRLWLARTFLHLFKKLTYPFGLQHHFCMNYFVSGADGMILEKNIYTATEVVTLMPMCGSLAFEIFYRTNNWTNEFLPTNYMHVSAACEVERSLPRRLVEKLLNNVAGDYLDTFLMSLTDRRWRAKARRRRTNSKGAVMKLHTGKHFAKPDPSVFQNELLRRYKDRVSSALLRFDETNTFTDPPYASISGLTSFSKK